MPRAAAGTLLSHQGLCGPLSGTGHSAGILVHLVAQIGLFLQTCIF